MKSFLRRFAMVVWGVLSGFDRVVFKGSLPDLFREGQGIVASGTYRADGVFQASEVLAKHDEKYMPKEVVDALKKSGEWQKGDGSLPSKPVADAKTGAAS